MLVLLRYQYLSIHSDYKSGVIMYIYWTRYTEYNWDPATGKCVCECVLLKKNQWVDEVHHPHLSSLSAFYSPIRM